MNFTIRRCLDKEIVEELHRRTFEKDIPFDGDVWWVAWHNKKPVAFATGRRSKLSRGWWMHTRVGVLPEARGHGLQRRLLRARERYAKSNGYKGCLTYTANWNTPSLLNILQSGYTIYDPVDLNEKKTKRDGFTYLSKRFKKRRR